MEIRFFIDEETGDPHVYLHGVSETEVAEVLSAPIEDRQGADETRVAIGRTEGGRLLRIIYVRDPTPPSIFVITAYVVSGRVAWALRRRMRGR
ncbi:MAG TPA: hypothetical protein VNE62_02240 [Actinomycetota bacterium]|nr:hypothetical protein [Actinomycetota bacterium]